VPELGSFGRSIPAAVFLAQRVIHGFDDVFDFRCKRHGISSLRRPATETSVVSESPIIPYHEEIGKLIRRGYLAFAGKRRALPCER